MADMIAKAVDLVRFNRVCCTFYRKIENEIKIVTFLRQYHWYSIALICPVFPNKNEMCVNYTTKMHPIATHAHTHYFNINELVCLLFFCCIFHLQPLYRNYTTMPKTSGLKWYPKLFIWKIVTVFGLFFSLSCLSESV